MQWRMCRGWPVTPHTHTPVPTRTSPYVPDSPQHDPRPRHRNSTGAVSRDDGQPTPSCYRRSGPGSGRTRLQPTAIRPSTPRNRAVGTPRVTRHCWLPPWRLWGQWERWHRAMVPLTRHSTLVPGVAVWNVRCDLAPQSPSFGTVALRERQHLATTPTTRHYEICLCPCGTDTASLPVVHPSRQSSLDFSI